jgi:predicted aspartyl protease
MRSRGGNGVGRFSVEFEVANNDDLALVRRGLLPPDQVRRETIQGLVDPRVMKLALPQAVVKRLGLRLGDTILVHSTGGRKVQRRVAEGVFLKLLGRDDTFTAIIEPRRRYALIGGIVLQALDLLVDARTQRVVPRDPRGPIYEIESTGSVIVGRS